MTKTLSKWFRKFHRWIAVPTALAIPAALIIKLVGSEELVATWERLDAGDGDHRRVLIFTALHCQRTAQEEGFEARC